MKHFQVLFLILSCLAPSYAQIPSNCRIFNRDECAENEIGANLYNITNFGRRYFPEGQYFCNQNYVNGFLYKRHCGKAALRLGFDLDRSNYFYEEKDKYHYFKDSGQNHIGALKLGFEWKLNNRRLQPFVAADLQLKYGRIKGISGGYGDIVWWYKEHNYNTRVAEVSISPLFGVKCRPTSRFSISLETGLCLAYYRNKDRVSAHRESGTLRYFNPLQLLSVNYHFYRFVKAKPIPH